MLEGLLAWLVLERASWTLALEWSRAALKRLVRWFCLHVAAPDRRRDQLYFPASLGKDERALVHREAQARSRERESLVAPQPIHRAPRRQARKLWTQSEGFGAARFLRVLGSPPDAAPGLSAAQAHLAKMVFRCAQDGDAGCASRPSLDEVSTRAHP